LSQQIRRLEEIVGTPLLQRRRDGLRLTPAGRVLLNGSRNVLALVDQELSRTRQVAGVGRLQLRVAMPPGLPESLAVPATASLQEAASAANVALTWLEMALDADFSLIGTRRADAGLAWLTAQTVPAGFEAMAVGEFEPEVWVPSAHPAGCRGAISLEELAGMQVIHGPRRAQPGIYDAWLTVMQAVDARFEFSDPPFRHSLAMTLALVAAGNQSAAVLSGPAVATGGQAWPVRRSRLADTCGMVRVSLEHHSLTASAALVWNTDLARPLQQMLVGTADSLADAAHPQSADLISLTTA
jgi:DNA-binding transcriptional LysR family regulator